MAKEKGSRTVLIIVLVIAGVLLLGGLGVGFSYYYLYKIGKSTNTIQDQTQSTANWQTYTNNRYNFSIKYPKTFTGQESINGDGTTLTSTSPAITISASGTLNSQNQSLDEYLNAARADLFSGIENGEEIAANDTTLGGLPAQERKWQYINSVDGTQTITNQTTALKNNNFFTVRIVIAYSDYSQYAPMFDQILKNFKIQ